MVGEPGEVCAAKSIINPDFWLVLWLGPEDPRPGDARATLQRLIDFRPIFELVSLDGSTLLKRILRCSLAPSSASEKNVYVYSCVMLTS